MLLGYDNSGGNSKEALPDSCSLPHHLERHREALALQVALRSLTFVRDGESPLLTTLYSITAF